MRVCFAIALRVGVVAAHGTLFQRTDKLRHCPIARHLLSDTFLTRTSSHMTYYLNFPRPSWRNVAYFIRSRGMHSFCRWSAPCGTMWSTVSNLAAFHQATAAAYSGATIPGLALTPERARRWLQPVSLQVRQYMSVY